MKASVLAVGTELTSGQIVNANASFISEKLATCGVQTGLHLTVPDQRNSILEGLHFLAAQHDLIFVTGGLGPTSDDFTREIIAEWLQLPLRFDEKSWSYVVRRLTARGSVVREMQKQQCFFPEGAQVLENQEGTAHAFQINREINGKRQTVFVLPGPPREVQRVWDDHITEWLALATKNLDKRITKAWDTLGLGESDVATLVIEALASFPRAKELEVGYRVHRPYVEVKISYDEKQAAVFRETILQVDKKLEKITMTRDFADIVKQLMPKISELDFTFYDFLTNGYLHSRLSPALKNQKRWSFKQSAQNDITADFFENEENFLALLPHDQGSCLVLAALGTKRLQKTFEAPMKSPQMLERRLQYFSEMALLEFSTVLL